MQPSSELAPPAGPQQVRLGFTPSPEHVRTARLVAVAVARRAGFDDASLDEVRLAVGEACARAVRRSLATGSQVPVRVTIIEDRGLQIEVEEHAGWSHLDGETDAVSLALVEGLTDTSELVVLPAGSPNPADASKHAGAMNPADATEHAGATEHASTTESAESGSRLVMRWGSRGRR